MKKPKALLIHIETTYINPWFNHYIKVLKNVFNLDIFNPGKSEVEKIKINFENYEFIISSLNLLLFFLHKNPSFEKYQLKNFNLEKLKKFKNLYKSIIDNSNSTIFISDIDHYSIEKKAIDIIQETGAYIIARNLEFLRSKQSMLEFNLEKESFSNKVNDNWRNFVKDNQFKIIALQGVISRDEFLENYNLNRPYQISVPGVEYYQRKIIKNKVKKLNLSSKNLPSIFNKLLLRFSSRMYKAQFINTLRSSVCCYTNGSALGYPIRKFFEIPANKSLLLCESFEGFEHFGFEDNTNCLIVNEENLYNKYHDINKDKNTIIKLINNAYNLIYKNHTIEARSSQLHESIFKILNKEFKGSAWINGKYVHF